MAILQLFGAPEPEDKKVVGTAAVVNYFPKINLQGQLLWEQRPGLTAVPLTTGSNRLTGTVLQSDTPTLGTPALTVLTVPTGDPGDCIPISYAWVPQGGRSWDINSDGTLHGDTLIQPESGIATLTCYFNISTHIENPEGKKWTITGIYRNSSNSKIVLALTDMIDGEEGSYFELTLDNSLTSKRFHINLTSLYIVELRSNFVSNPHVTIGDPLPNTENWIECIRIEKNDFGEAPEETVIYDD